MPAKCLLENTFTWCLATSSINADSIFPCRVPSWFSFRTESLWVDGTTHRVANQGYQVEGNLAELLLGGRNVSFLSTCQTVILIDEVGDAFATERLLAVQRRALRQST